MSVTMEDRKQLITNLLNDTHSSLSTIMPINYEMKEPRLLEETLNIQFGVFISISIDINGKLILAGNPTIFSSIGESMFGMALEGEMLLSFTGELGNLFAGSLSTNLAKREINTDISSPIILQGNTTLSGFQKALQMTVVFENGEEMEIYLLLDL